MNENITETMRGVATNLGGAATGETTYEVCKEVYAAAKGTKGEVTYITTYLGDNLYVDSDNSILIAPKKYMDYTQIYYYGDGGSDGKTYNAYTWADETTRTTQCAVGNELAYIQWVGSYLEVLAKGTLTQVGTWTQDPTSANKWITTVKFDNTVGTVLENQAYSWRLYKRLDVDGLSYATIVGTGASGVTSSTVYGSSAKGYSQSSIAIGYLSQAVGERSVAIGGSTNGDYNVTIGAYTSQLSTGSRNVCIGHTVFDETAYQDSYCVMINGGGGSWNKRLSSAVVINGTTDTSYTTVLNGDVGNAGATYATALGYGTVNNSYKAIAIGAHNCRIDSVTSNGAIFIGSEINPGSTSHSPYGIAIGYGATIKNPGFSSTGSIAIGYNTTVSGTTNGYTNIAIGSNGVNVNGATNTFVGISGGILGVGASGNTVFGNTCYVNSNGGAGYHNNVIVGNNNNATSDNTILIGNGLGTWQGWSPNQIGTYPDYTNKKSINPVFVIGNGSDNSNRSNLVEIDHNGDIYIPYGNNEAKANKKLQTYLLPEPPATGNYHLVSRDGTVQWELI